MVPEHLQGWKSGASGSAGVLQILHVSGLLQPLSENIGSKATLTWLQLHLCSSSAFGYMPSRCVRVLVVEEMPEGK